MAGEDRSDRIPSALRKMLRTPPIMAGEDRADYDELVERVRKEVNPRQPHEWMLMMDIVDAEWELLRLRGLKVGMLHAALPRALNSQVAEGGGLPQLDPEMDPGLALRKHLFGMLTGDKAARGELKKLFAEHDVNWDVLTAVAFQSVVVPQLHTDRMAGNARERRRAAYAELDRLRAIKPATAVARRRTVAPDDAVDVEEVAAPPTAPNTSAASAGNGSGRTRAVFSRG